MNPQHDNFVELRRLLALKRHEQPPPGYFDGFSHEVMARIRSGEQIRDNSFFASFSWDSSWLQRLWSIIETKPIFAGSFGLAVCGLLLAGIFFSENTDPARAAGAVASTMHEQPAQGDVAQLLVPSAGSFSVIPASTVQPRDSLFERVDPSKGARPVMFSAPLGN